MLPRLAFIAQLPTAFLHGFSTDSSIITMASSPHASNDKNHKNDIPSPSTAEPSYRLHSDTRQIVRPSATVGDDSTNDRRDASLLLFSNDRMKVSDFRLCPSQTSVEYKHEYPTVRWQVAYNGTAEHSVKITNPAGLGDQICGDAADRTVFFVEAGTTWEITNTSNETEYRQIIFEYLSSKPKHTNQEIQDMFANAIHSTDVGTELLFENELCRCWDFYLDPSEGGGADTVHHHCLDYVFINVAPSRLLGIDPVTLSLDDLLFDSVSEDNQVTWNSIPGDAGADVSFAHGGKNGYDDRPMREYLIELK